MVIIACYAGESEMRLMGGTGSMKTQKERMLAGELYVADDPELGRENHRAKR
ncbi:maltose acetyltransferase domain-containing protein, partial [Clostridioides difficile]|uniref:maltose acetyltransferase domain-containing protein n=1 Tax=Clostridioides difficile TaxID=1496 RepID=UPI0027D25B6B